MSVPLFNMSGVGEVQRVAVAQARAVGFGDEEAQRVALVVTEVSSNLVQHGGGGELLLRSWSSKSGGCCMDILALDKGPGMQNVSACLRDGFSTVGAKGMGLGIIARSSTAFDVFSSPGKGTGVLCRIGHECFEPHSDSKLEWGAVCVAQREEIVSGDAWAVQEQANVSTVLVVDGLGHGLHAFDAAQRAMRTFWENPGERPEPFLRRLDGALRGSRGAAAAVARVDWANRELHFAGVGNIAGTLESPNARSKGLVSHNGTAGQSIERIQLFTHPWPKGGLLVMHSDGLGHDWELEAYPGLSQKYPSLIAGILYRDFGRRRDDVVVVVARERAQQPEGMT